MTLLKDEQSPSDYEVESCAKLFLPWTCMSTCIIAAGRAVTWSDHLIMEVESCAKFNSHLILFFPQTWWCFLQTAQAGTSQHSDQLLHT
jgi:hypothetical protein